jgi:hypothetical protein
MRKDSSSYFWSSDMIIVRDLSLNSIKESVQALIEDGYLDSSCAFIGMIPDIFDERESYESIQEISDSV